MSYVYEEQRSWLFTDEGQRAFLRLRDYVNKQLDTAGAIRMQEAFRGCSGVGDTWKMLALVDRMEELGELREITGLEVAGQHRVFVRSGR